MVFMEFVTSKKSTINNFYKTIHVTHRLVYAPFPAEESWAEAAGWTLGI